MILVLYFFQLFKIQILEHAKYVFLADASGNRKQILKAARGEIVDRNGVVIASNKNGFDIALNKALIKKEDEYNTIISLVNMLREYDVELIDYLPMTLKKNNIYLNKNNKIEFKRLLNLLGEKESVPAKKVWNKIVKRYSLQNYKISDAKIIAGIKYSMEVQDYSFSNPYIISRNVPMDVLIKLKENNYKLNGVEIIEKPSREYILKDFAPHIIGSVGPIYAEEYEKLKNDGYNLNDTIGKNGIEKYFEKYLKGKDGERVIKIDYNGKVDKIYENNYPIPGNTVKLTIDSKLQYTAQHALEKQIHYLNKNAPAGKGKEADGGAVVVLDVKTGEILAMASYPTYNINEYNKNFYELINNNKKPLFNRPLQGIYAPGSCYKPVIAVAALQEGVAQPTSTVYCGHVYNFFSAYKPKCLGAHGNINVMDALKLSCNIYFYDVGRILGINRINKYSSQFGFGQHTGIQLPENVGQLASPQLREDNGGKWYPGDVVQAAIGQSDNLFSPLQLANYVSTIANRGKRMKVSIIKEIKHYDKKSTIYNHKPILANKVSASAEVFETVVEGMSRASRIGTARRYFGNYQITVPSKTGTPETTGLCNSTFICFAPDKDSKIAIAVVIEKGWHGYTCAPVAKEIIDEYFGYNKFMGK